MIVRLKLTDAEPDLSAAQDSYQLNSERGSIPDSPPNVLGDASRRSFRPGSDDNSQVATIDFLRANAHVTIRYEGWGNHGFDPQFIPPQAQQAATLDFAQQVAKTLGTPT
ncbi:hypothetical protein [Saccharopolyspora flava]|uniref:Uncharacterized protein n=1 Tax=Saccharopolyspora flava TaxID=95161 RepID=A0A1I6UZQ3_9PSEU|nr:hypothetical protein [Saccharopolyspora flava]SFT06874.1 hypothetical protein SAMN05660874_05432 [Saccharopolyspora flava]